MGNGTILIFEKNGRVSEILVRAARKAGFSVKMCHPRDIALDLREYAGTFVWFRPEETPETAGKASFATLFARALKKGFPYAPWRIFPWLEDGNGTENRRFVDALASQMDKKRPFASPDAMAEFKVALFRNAVRRETLADGDAAFAEEVGRHFGALAKRLAEENGSGE